MRKSVTMLELVVTLVLIGIIATLAVVMYPGAVRYAIRSKANHALSLILHAEKIYYSDNGSFLTVLPDQFNALSAASGVDLTSVMNDTDWQYAVTLPYATAGRRSEAGVRYVNIVTGVFGGNF